MRKIKPETYKEMGMMPEKNAEFYPTICFDGNTLPEGKDWKVGKTYEVSMQIRMTGMSQRKAKSGSERAHFDFDIVGIETGKEIKGKVGRYSGDEKE